VDKFGCCLYYIEQADEYFNFITFL